MWNAVGAAVLKTVTDHIVNAGKPNEPVRGNYNIQGHVNNLPINLTVSQSPQSPGAFKNSSTSNETTRRPANNQPQKPFKAFPNKSTCNNCKNDCSNVNNPKKGSNGHQKHNDKGFVMVNVPKNGNLEVNIRRTESQFAKMNLRTAKGPGSCQRQQNKNQLYQKGSQGNKSSTPNNNNMKPQVGVKYQKTKILCLGKTWMYLGRLKIGTTEGDVKSYLIELFPGYNFVIVPLPLYRDGKLPCFKVLVDDAILDNFQQLDHWPDGVKITKFHDNFKK